MKIMYANRLLCSCAIGLLSSSIFPDVFGKHPTPDQLKYECVFFWNITNKDILNSDSSSGFNLWQTRA